MSDEKKALGRLKDWKEGKMIPDSIAVLLADAILEIEGHVSTIRRVYGERLDMHVGRMDGLLLRIQELERRVEKELDGVAARLPSPSGRKHKQGCPRRYFSYEVGSGEDFPDCTCAEDGLSGEELADQLDAEAHIWENNMWAQQTSTLLRAAASELRRLRQQNEGQRNLDALTKRFFTALHEYDRHVPNGPGYVAVDCEDVREALKTILHPQEESNDG